MQFACYLPYGEALADEHTVTDTQPYKFSGKELDSETGLYYFGARYYNPKLALWYGVDPLVEKYPGLGSAVYTVANPIKYIDPDGKDIVIAGKNKSSVTLTTDLIDITVDASKLGIDFKGSYALQGEDVLSAGLDIVGVLDPTGIADGLNAGLQAKNGDFLGAGISTLGLIPYIGDIAKVGKIGKDIKIINNAIDAVKVVNGNSKASQKAQHVYEIVNKATGKVEKVGISGGKVSKSGQSYRATRQVNKLNKNGGDYASQIVERIPAGQGAREKALQSEKALANKHKSTLNRDLHRRPKPE